MTPDKVIRIALWMSVPFNFVAAYSAANPASFMGQLMGLPFEAPAIYTVLLAWFVLIFGVAYGWLAMQKQVNRVLVGFAAYAKTGVFALVAMLWVAGQCKGITVLFVTGDLLFAGVFFWWLVKTARYANK